MQYICWRMDSYRAVISFIILISFHMGQTLRCACKKDLKICTSIHDMQVNFKTAQQTCMNNGGKLLTPLSKKFDSLLFNKTGHFWIGTDGDGSSRSRHSGGDSVTVNKGRKDVAYSSKCVMVSSNGKLIERSCEEKADGFLCDDIEWENCWENAASEVQILDKEDCLYAPCEHFCMEIPGGHMCSCHLNFRPTRKNPKHCEYHCVSHTCSLPKGIFKCPEGFVKDVTQCVDYDECMLSYCEQKCINTIGSYKCSCNEGFILVNKTKCVINNTPITGTLVTPSVNYTSSHAALTTPGEYIGLTLFVILVISALIGFLYYLRKNKSDLLLKDTGAPEDTTIQETQLQL